MSTSPRGTVLVASFLAATTVPTLFAHSFLPPTAGQAITIIPDISVSRAAYRTISTSTQVDVYEFTAKKGQEIYIQVTVPVLGRQASFAPSLAVVSIGADNAAFDVSAIGAGVVIDPPHDVVDAIFPHGGDDTVELPLVGVAFDNSPAVVFDEPVTGTRYWIRQTVTVAAPADGAYRIGIWSPDGAQGKYVLAPGQREAFGIGDILTLPSVRFQVRQFCEQPVWGDIVVESVLVIGAAVGVAALIALAF
jgi:hypothetical protein